MAESAYASCVVHPTPRLFSVVCWIASTSMRKVWRFGAFFLEFLAESGQPQLPTGTGVTVARFDAACHSE